MRSPDYLRGVVATLSILLEQQIYPRQIAAVLSALDLAPDDLAGMSEANLTKLRECYLSIAHLDGIRAGLSAEEIDRMAT